MHMYIYAHTYVSKYFVVRLCARKVNQKYLQLSFNLPNVWLAGVATFSCLLK